jgi:hypothetical protein
MRMPATGRMIKGVPKTKSKANGLPPLFSLPFILYLILFVVLNVSMLLGCRNFRPSSLWQCSSLPYIVSSFHNI